MKRGLIELLGVALFIFGCVLFMMVSQTATNADVIVQQGPGGTETRAATPNYPTYPFAPQMGRLWSPEALVYVNLYLSVLAVCVGVTLLLISIRWGLGTRDPTRKPGLGRAVWVALCASLVTGVALYTGAVYAPQTALDLLGGGVLLVLVGLTLRSGSGRAGWVALLMSLLVGVVLANLSGLAFPPLDPCSEVLGCPPWNPGAFGPPVGALLHTYPLAVLVALAMSLLLTLVGFALAWRRREALTPVVVRGLQLAPLLVVTLIGLVALFLFPLPYTL
jgi:hypothetical protein